MQADAALGSNSEDSEWLSLSDLMAGLMMVFLCIAVVMMRSVMEEREKIRALAIAYRDNQLAIYESLLAEFRDDLPRWGATIDKEHLVIAFNDAGMFDTGATDMNAQATDMMRAFFPRYLKAIEPYQYTISAIHIEGHTSSEWGDGQDRNRSYFNNLSLSQQRARAVLEFVHTLIPESDAARMRAQVAAVGYSSARPVRTANGSEDAEKSRRVAFRVITNSEAHINQILEEAL